MEKLEVTKEMLNTEEGFKTIKEHIIKILQNEVKDWEGLAMVQHNIDNLMFAKNVLNFSFEDCWEDIKKDIQEMKGKKS